MSGWKVDLVVAWSFLALAVLNLLVGHWTAMVADLFIAMLSQELYTLKRGRR